jgi:hypothetical protein
MTRFFARLTRSGEEAFTNWRSSGAELPRGGEEVLHRLCGTKLHLLSFLNFDGPRVRPLFQHPTPEPSQGGSSPLTPPWSGSRPRAYLERAGSNGWAAG